MSPYLPKFIEMLDARYLAVLDILDDGRHDNFENRFKIQKYVFLAKYFGLEMGYRYNVYIHGPYSSALADDYYELAKGRGRRRITSNHTNALPDTFDENRFYEFVADKDLDWLEAASTLLSLNKSFRNRNRLLDRVTNMKDHIPREKIESILSELEKSSLIDYHSSIDNSNN